MSERLKSTDIPSYFTRTFSSSFLLQDILLKETQENRHPYYLVRLQDASGTVFGTIWKECMKEEYLNMSHKIVDIKSLVTQNQDGHYNLVIREMSLCNEYDMSDYVNGLGEEESRKYFELLWKLISSCRSLCFGAPDVPAPFLQSDQPHAPYGSGNGFKGYGRRFRQSARSFYIA